MNEKIKQFALQAGIITPSENDIAPPMEKFAELIVRECAEVAYVAEPYHAYDLILKRFELKGEK